MKFKFNQITLENLLYKADKTRLTQEEVVTLQDQKIALEEEILLVGAIALDCRFSIQIANVVEKEEDVEDIVDFFSEIYNTYADLFNVLTRLEKHACETLWSHLG